MSTDSHVNIKPATRNHKGFLYSARFLQVDEH